MIFVSSRELLPRGPVDIALTAATFDPHTSRKATVYIDLPALRQTRAASTLSVSTTTIEWCRS